MKVIQISDKQWDAGITSLRARYQVHGPVNGRSGVEIRALKESEPARPKLPPTRFSVKQTAFPQSQVMFQYTLDPENDEYHILKPVAADTAPKAVFGIRPCDGAAFEIVRRNFDNPEYPDTYWLENYHTLTLVGMACEEPMATCFCPSTGGGPYNEEGLDMLLVDVEEGYMAKILTEKGQALARAAGWNVEADYSEWDNRKQAAEGRIESTVDTDAVKAVDVNDLFEAPFWEEISFACLNCGTCTYSCPTCWCFDIQDETRGKSGIRMRNWDSCMYPLFTLEGSGHNPRTAKMQRVRQRFMHKLKYYPDKYEAGVQCVGCGRCIRLCPVNIDIRVVCDMMNRYQPVNP